jgi:hypothetical protein
MISSLIRDGRVAKAMIKCLLLASVFSPSAEFCHINSLAAVMYIKTPVEMHNDFENQS